MENQVVLITGTRKGIGEYLAHHFVKKGAKVEGCSRKPPDWSLQNYTHHCLDVSDEAAVKAMVKDAFKRHGRIDVLINNAGIACMNHTLLTPAETVERVMSTNMQGTFLFSREVVKRMKKRGYGRIVNFSTIAVPLRLEGEAIYAASKSAVEMFTTVMAREVAELGITCNVIGPTAVDTDLVRRIPQYKIDAILDKLAVKRFANFEDVANVVDFFVSPASGYVTGQVLYLGGP